MPERVLVTGVLGCLGAWVSRCVLEDGDAVVGYDLGERHEPARARPRRRRRPRRPRHGGHHRPRRRRAAPSTSTRSRGSSTSPRCRCPSSAPTRRSACRSTSPAPSTCSTPSRGGSAGSPTSPTRARPPSTPPTDPSPAPESGGARPGTLYGVSKLADEGIARVYHAEHGRAVDRAAAVRRLRAGPRPGHDLRADDRRCSRPSAASRSTSASPARRSTTTRPTSRGRS